MKVYVAGKYDDTDIVNILENIRVGTRISTELLLKGYEPFCPWLDYQFYFQLRDGEHLTKSSFQRYSMAWLKVSDVVLMLPGWTSSNGAKAEMETAMRMGIPVVFKIEDLKKLEATND